VAVWESRNSDLDDSKEPGNPAGEQKQQDVPLSKQQTGGKRPKA
jgi:hypothetical protein